MPKTTIHPFVAAALRSVAQVGAKALGAAVNSVLADVGSGADEVSARTKQAREKLEHTGVGSVRPKARSKKKRGEDEEEDE